MVPGRNVSGMEFYVGCIRASGKVGANENDNTRTLGAFADQWFESGFLQRRVMCELGNGSARRKLARCGDFSVPERTRTSIGFRGGPSDGDCLHGCWHYSAGASIGL